MSDSDAASESTVPDAAGESIPSESTETGGRRDVVVPLRLYKTITVFSTLIAALSILAGFILLDAATLQMSVLRRLIVTAVEAIGVTPNQELLGGLLAVGGLSLMALGSGVFILSSRFRAEGMGNSQEDADEESTNG
ncbi:hypothetical protein halTADL_0954 [Halohasta litchfieldiae]|jgi:hypothetical protein|uniref:DUF7315 domain-containing protein n=1 Tax=Halohasta litchfieldiae TaxID=1073996 RepID=A0A1H6T3R6_9EURY|nr:hypothetical protein [Halohasta litchfieldiae]ATW87750.1 hypothetical protein halTADL_0954 [Halohasta litchfieldiae]SEI74678.1 hypothetical protein SAMN05444271_10726 [Halohasta litchfieldiae]